MPRPISTVHITPDFEKAYLRLPKHIRNLATWKDQWFRKDAFDPLTEGEIKKHFPSLWTYLEEGKTRGLHNLYLCRHRSPWYVQEKRPAPPVVCTYLGRGDTK